MQASKEWMKEGGYSNKISFTDLQPHKVKLINEKAENATIGGVIVKGMKYLVEEAGEQKTIFTASIGLVSKLSMCELGDIVTIKMGKANNKSFYTVTKEGGAEIKTPDEEEHVEGADATAEPKW